MLIYLHLKLNQLCLFSAFHYTFSFTAALQKIMMLMFRIYIFIKDALNSVKTFIMLKKVSNKCCSFEFSVHQRILKNKFIAVYTNIHFEH